MSRRTLAVTLAVAIVAIAVACSKSEGGNPAGPSATVTVTGIQISGPSTVDVGQTVAFTASAMLSNGSTRPVAGGVWGTDAPAVVSIDNNGQVVALVTGTATIWIDAEGHRGTLLLMVRLAPLFDNGASSGSQPQPRKRRRNPGTIRELHLEPECRHHDHPLARARAQAVDLPQHPSADLR